MLEPQNFVNDLRVEPAQKTYFYERENGSVIAVNAKEAWEIEQKCLRRLLQMKQFGVSDGKIMQQAIIDSKQVLKTQGLEAAQAKIREAFVLEQAAAKGHFERPPNADVVGGTPGAGAYLRR